jgi:putative glutamine amidotransferase
MGDTGEHKRRPVIGLPGRRKRSAQVEGFPETLDHLEIDMYMADYARFVLRAGGLPIHLPLDADPLAYVELIDGLVLTGGADIDPVSYDTANTDSNIEPIRDTYEFALLDAVLEADLPVLGICRGLQLLNVHLDGSLHQHVPDHERFDVDPAARTHNISIEPASRLSLMFGSSLEVNSLHHQTIDTLGDGLSVVARAADGTVEAIEMPGRDVVAVQWHPEMLDPTHTGIDPLAQWLVHRASA